MTRTRPEPQPGIEARFPDICQICHEDVIPGDRVVFRRGRPVHVTCHGGQDE